MKKVFVVTAALLIGAVLLWKASSTADGPSPSATPRPTGTAANPRFPTGDALPSTAGSPGAKRTGPDPAEVKAVSREMIQELLKEYQQKPSNQHKLKAFYDRIRAYGPAAVAPLLEILAGADSTDFKFVTILALSGLRYMGREVPAYVKQGLSPEEIAKKLDVPVETIRRQIEAGEWKTADTEAMVEASWAALQSASTPEFRENAIGMLAKCGDESPAAVAHLVEVMKSTSADLQLREKALRSAGERLKPDQAGPLVDLAADPAETLSFRLKAGIEYLKCAKEAGDPNDRARLQQSAFAAAQSLVASGTPSAERCLGIDLYGRFEGAAAHPVLTTMLDSEKDDATRCQLMGTLTESKGLDGAATIVRRIAAETAPSKAKTLATQLLKVLPRSN